MKDSGYYKKQGTKLIYDCHSHLLTYKDVPSKYLGIRIPWSKRTFKRLSHFLDQIIKGHKDPLSHVAYFLDYFQKSQEEILDKQISVYPSNTVFCPMLMDMRAGIKGKLILPYEEQIQKLIDLKKKYPKKILPFLALDPNNPKMEDIYHKHFDDPKKSEFIGIKLYPSLGYLPSHPRLMKLYQDISNKKIPITVHCSSGIVHNSKKRLVIEGTYLTKEGKRTNKKIKKTFLFKKSYGNFFNTPKNWEPVLEQFPNLKVCLAHFGGDDEWVKWICKNKKDSWPTTIIHLIRKYPNVYTDVSFLLHERRIFDALKTKLKENTFLRKKTLFGTDFTMILVEGHIKSMLADFSTAMGEDLMYWMQSIAPLSFLFDKSSQPKQIKIKKS